MPNAPAKAAHSATEGVVTETQTLQRDYWSGLREVLLQRNGVVRPRKPQPGKWASFSVGRVGFWLYAGIERKESRLEIGICSEYALQPLLKIHQEAIEREVGEVLNWGDNETGWVCLKKENVDPKNRNDWPSQHLWMAEKLEAFHKTFAPRIRELDLEEQEEADEE